jgi:hypothetical protein
MEVQVAVSLAWHVDYAELVDFAHAAHLRVRRAFGTAACTHKLARACRAMDM